MNTKCNPFPKAGLNSLRDSTNQSSKTLPARCFQMRHLRRSPRELHRCFLPMKLTYALSITAERLLWEVPACVHPGWNGHTTCISYALVAGTLYIHLQHFCSHRESLHGMGWEKQRNVVKPMEENKCKSTPKVKTWRVEEHQQSKQIQTTQKKQNYNIQYTVKHHISL